MATATDVDTTSLLPHLSIGTGWERRGWVVLGLFFILSLVVLLVMPWQKADFDAYHRAAVKVSQGKNPYVLDEFGVWFAYRYPPALAYLMTPLGHLDVGWAGRIWFVGNWLALVGCLLLSLSLVLGPRPWPAETGAVALLALYVCSCYTNQTLFQGQVSLLMVLACLGWAVCQRAGRNFSGGVLLAAGCALKLAPIVLVPYLVIRKDWRGLAGLVAGGLFFVLIPAPWVGVDGTVRLHLDWFRHAKVTQAPYMNYRVGNQGLMGMLSRLPPVSNGAVCYSATNLAALENSYPFLVAGLAAALYGWILRDRRARGKSLSSEQQRQRDNLYLVLLFLFMTLTHPSAWRCNFVSLLLPCTVLAQHVCHRRPGYAISRAVLILVFMAWIWSALQIVIPLAWTWPSITQDTTVLDILKGKIVDQNWWLGIWLLQGAHFWTALLVGGVCWWISNRNLEIRQAAFGSPRPR